MTTNCQIKRKWKLNSIHAIKTTQKITTRTRGKWITITKILPHQTNLKVAAEVCRIHRSKKSKPVSI